MKCLIKLFSKKHKIWMGSFNMMHTFYFKDKCKMKDLPDFKFTPPPPQKTDNMKTILQELVDIMNQDQVSFTEWFIENYKMLLEKEKEQIMFDYINGEDSYLSPEQYYEQTYK